MTRRFTPGHERTPLPAASQHALTGAPAPELSAADALAAAVSSPAGDGDEVLAASTWRPADFAEVQECLTLLGKAIRQFHTYPETSPLCLDAIAAAQKALVNVSGREHVAFRVTPSSLVVDEVPITGGVVAQELSRRLHRAQIAAVEIARTASARDLTRFCKDLSGFGDSTTAAMTFAELLVEHGVSHITVRQAHRPQVFDVGVLHEPVHRLVEHEKQRRQTLFAAGGPVQHLYPPDKGWVRVDPSAQQQTFSLVDLAVLIDNPAEVALALMRLTGDEAEATHDPRIAFEHKFSDLALIFSAVDPRLARLLFSKLSRAVLELEPDRRSRLLKRTVLPGLLDGKLDGSVLSDFPDVDLAEALCLLLDLETASPDVLTTALDRLGLPPERREAVVPLLEERLKRSSDKVRPDAYGHDHAIETYARRLIAMKPGEARNFAEYTAFDLSVTDQTKTTVADLVAAIGHTDFDTVQLEARYQLVKLEPNPALVATFMDRTLVLFHQLESRQQWATLSRWAGRFRVLAASLVETRPDVAAAIRAGLEKFCTVTRVLGIAELYKSDGKHRALTHAFIDGFGATSAGAMLAALDASDTSAAARPLVALMTDHVDTFAPALLEHLPTRAAAGRQAILKVLGAAGATYAPPVIALLQTADEATGREAMRALAKMGTMPAAAAVAACLQRDVAWARAAAEEALWHFPPAQAAAQVRKLLANREFVMAHPEMAGRLMDRAAQAGATGLAPVLASIAPLRFRFWKPAIVRVALKARQLLHT